MYGCGAWTMNKQKKRKIDYTQILGMVQNVDWRQHMTNEKLYGRLPKISTKIRKLCLQLAGHCVRHTNEIASKLVLWEPKTLHEKEGVTITSTR